MSSLLERAIRRGVSNAVGNAVGKAVQQAASALAAEVIFRRSHPSALGTFFYFPHGRGAEAEFFHAFDPQHFKPFNRHIPPLPRIAVSCRIYGKRYRQAVIFHRNGDRKMGCSPTGRKRYIPTHPRYILRRIPIDRICDID